MCYLVFCNKHTICLYLWAMSWHFEAFLHVLQKSGFAPQEARYYRYLANRGRGNTQENCGFVIVFSWCSFCVVPIYYPPFFVNGNQFKPMYMHDLLDINEHQWEPLKIKGNQQMQMNIGATQWKSITFNGSQCCSMRIYGTPWTTMKTNANKWKVSGNQCTVFLIQQQWVNRNR